MITLRSGATEAPTTVVQNRYGEKTIARYVWAWPTRWWNRPGHPEPPVHPGELLLGGEGAADPDAPFEGVPPDGVGAVDDREAPDGQVAVAARPLRVGVGPCVVVAHAGGEDLHLPAPRRQPFGSLTEDGLSAADHVVSVAGRDEGDAPLTHRPQP